MNKQVNLPSKRQLKAVEDLRPLWSRLWQATPRRGESIEAMTHRALADVDSKWLLRQLTRMASKRPGPRLAPSQQKIAAVLLDAQRNGRKLTDGQVARMVWGRRYEEATKGGRNLTDAQLSRELSGEPTRTRKQYQEIVRDVRRRIRNLLPGDINLPSFWASPLVWYSLEYMTSLGLLLLPIRTEIVSVATEHKNSRDFQRAFRRLLMRKLRGSFRK